MAEENKHPPTTEEQTPPEMPGKAPKNGAGRNPLMWAAAPLRPQR